MAKSRTPERSAAAFEDASESTGTTPVASVNPRTLPRVEESVQAQSLTPGQSCTLTPGCSGKVRVYSSHKRTETREDGSRQSVTQQYLRCSKCGRVPVNPKLVTQQIAAPKEATGTLFDRRNPKAD